MSREHHLVQSLEACGVTVGREVFHGVLERLGTDPARELDRDVVGGFARELSSDGVHADLLTDAVPMAFSKGGDHVGQDAHPEGALRVDVPCHVQLALERGGVYAGGDSATGGSRKTRVWRAPFLKLQCTQLGSGPSSGEESVCRGLVGAFLGRVDGVDAAGGEPECAEAGALAGVIA